MLGNLGKPDAAVSGCAIDADQQAEIVNLPPCVLLLRKISNEADSNAVLDSLSARLGTL
jgi:hypothetical protein